MKLFISWSGSLSQRVADLLHKYLPVMINDLDLFLSKHDVESGSRWSLELTRALTESSFGILCLTPDNLASAWMLFEAGALTKHVEGRACGLLIGPLKPIDIGGPLSQFQHRAFSKDGFDSLLQDLNTKLDKPLPIGQVQFVMDTLWPNLYREYQDILETIPGETKRAQRDQRDILEEILSRIRIIENNQSKLAATNVTHHLKIKGDQHHIGRFLNILRSTEFGGYPTVFQQYSHDRAAVNIQSEGHIDVEKLNEVAKECGVELELMVI